MIASWHIIIRAEQSFLDICSLNYSLTSHIFFIYRIVVSTRTSRRKAPLTILLMFAAVIHFFFKLCQVLKYIVILALILFIRLKVALKFNVTSLQVFTFECDQIVLIIQNDMVLI